MKALNLSINGKVVEHILPSFKKMDSFLKEWNLGVKDQRGLFLRISNILKETKGSAEASFKFLIKYLGTFSDEDVSAMNEANEEALHAIIAFVKAPDMFQCGLLDMPVIVQLEKGAKHALAYQLLKIFLTGRLDDYMNFHEANSELLKTYGLLHEDCVEKMRLLPLVDFGMTETGQIPYSMIKDTLNIDDIEVESWVVKAISTKLLICKIDKMNQLITVRCAFCGGRPLLSLPMLWLY
ncbi:hypothetical protein H5410_006736 [Solanum commersonii]|uniref:PCI domain-containing protein n=1 Tax=Solanum commersonii TaxID=4109 RepID=A0A9J6A9Y4_SOLCO|nr:hypothetical protein H5410_006736 [Solanum commersonii]